MIKIGDGDWATYSIILNLDWYLFTAIISIEPKVDQAASLMVKLGPGMRFGFNFQMSGDWSFYLDAVIVSSWPW